MDAGNESRYAEGKAHLPSGQDRRRIPRAARRLIQIDGSDAYRGYASSLSWPVLVAGGQGEKWKRLE